MTIKDIKIKPMEKGNLKAFVSATINDITINDMKIVQAKELFVSMPSREYTDKEGNKKYSDIVWLNKEQQWEVQKAIINEYQGSGQASDEVKEEEKETDPFEDFGNSIEINDDDLPF